MKARSTDYCAELILLTSISLLDLLRRCRYANVLNSGNEAIDKTNMRSQQTKIHYLAISKHAPSSRAKSLFDCWRWYTVEKQRIDFFAKSSKF